MRALFPYESMACLMFMCLPLLAGLSGPAACFAARLTLCGVDESLSIHSLYLAPSLGWILLWYGYFLL